MVVQSSGSSYTLSLFNIKITTKEGLEYACKRVTDATSVSFLVDPYATLVDHIAAWVYVDGSLLQKELVLRNDARVLIHNPEYLHTKDLEEAVATANAKLPQVSHKARDYDRRRGNVFLLVNFASLLILFAAMIFFWIAGKKGKRFRIPRKRKQKAAAENTIDI